MAVSVSPSHDKARALHQKGEDVAAAEHQRAVEEFDGGCRVRSGGDRQTPGKLRSSGRNASAPKHLQAHLDEHAFPRNCRKTNGVGRIAAFGMSSSWRNSHSPCDH